MSTLDQALVLYDVLGRVLLAVLTRSRPLDAALSVHPVQLSLCLVQRLACDLLAEALRSTKRCSDMLIRQGDALRMEFPCRGVDLLSEGFHPLCSLGAAIGLIPSGDWLAEVMQVRIQSLGRR
jgi:hypothetical protein